MSYIRQATGIALLAALLVLTVHGAAMASGPPEVLAIEGRMTGVTAYGDRVVWSSFDRDQRRYVLETWNDGQVERLPIRSRSVPFDADLGPGRDEAVNLVYSRCEREPSNARGLTLPLYVRGGGCRLWRFSFADGKERRVRREPGRKSEVLPSVWGKRLAFVQRRGPLTQRPDLRIFVRTLGVGHGGQYSLPTPRSLMARKAESAYLLRTDLFGRKVLSSWEYGETTCRVSIGGDKVGPEGSEVFLGSSVDQRRIARACTAERVKSLSAAVWLKGTVNALVFLQKGPRGRSEDVQRRYRADGSELGDAEVPEGTVAFAPGSRATFFVVFDSAAYIASGQDEFRVVRVADGEAAGQ